MLNQIEIMGRLTRDPELRSTAGGVSVVSFTLAVGRDVKDPGTGDYGADFIDVVAWRGTAEFVTNRCRKGDLVVVRGRLQIRDWTDRNENRRRTAEVNADSVYVTAPARDDPEPEAILPEPAGAALEAELPF